MKVDVSECSKLLSDDREPLATRFRALFTLRNTISQDSIDAIGKVLLTDDSDLLKHECAYCMGQMKDPVAIPYLIEALEDKKHHSMVRHESAEALGAIGKQTNDILELLKYYSKDDDRIVSETCILALARLEWYKNDEITRKESRSVYNAVDPTPSYPNTKPLDELKSIYLDEKQSLFERYRALFTLRNIGTKEAVAVICEGFFGSPSDSALFKHEVAFVLGQMQSSHSVEALSKKLADCQENEIVRHECAEALGSIGESETISLYLKDASRIVRESCQVALDMAEYFEDENQFDFIDLKNGNINAAQAGENQ